VSPDDCDMAPITPGRVAECSTELGPDMDPDPGRRAGPFARVCGHPAWSSGGCGLSVFERQSNGAQGLAHQDGTPSGKDGPVDGMAGAYRDSGCDRSGIPTGAAALA